MEYTQSKNRFLQVTKVNHQFGKLVALQDIHFDIYAGEVFGFLGRNGSGKSTLLGLLSGLRCLQEGQILVEGKPMSEVVRSLRAKTGVIFQQPSLDQRLSVIENLQLTATLHAIPRKETEKRIEEELKRIELWKRRKDIVKNLSGGMRRRLDIVRALLHRPSVLFMDEPTTGLDEVAFRHVWKLLGTYKQMTGLTIVLATHRAEEADQCDRLAMISEGHIQVVDSPEGLRQRVMSDIVLIQTDDVEALAEGIRQRWQLKTLIDNGTIFIECQKGHEWIPRLVEAFPNGRLKTISLRHPSLSDVFLKLTGHHLMSSKDVST